MSVSQASYLAVRRLVQERGMVTRTGLLSGLDQRLQLKTIIGALDVLIVRGEVQAEKDGSGDQPAWVYRWIAER